MEPDGVQFLQMGKTRDDFLTVRLRLFKDLDKNMHLRNDKVCR